MAVYYCDFENGSNSNNGSTWALAFLTLEYAMENATSGIVAGDTLYVRTGATPSKDTGTGTTTITSPGTRANPVIVVGVSHAATPSEPPVDADIAAVTDADIPTIQRTTGGRLFLNGFSSFTGMHFDCDDYILFGNAVYQGAACEGCKLTYSNILYAGNSLGAPMRFVNCEFAPNSTAVIKTSGGMVEIIGGSMSSTSGSQAFDNIRGAGLRAYGFDLSAIGNVTIVAPASHAGDMVFSNCALPATHTKVSTGNYSPWGKTEFINCFSGTKSAGTSSVDYYLMQGDHVIQSDTGVYRDSGAADPKATAFSYSMTPAANYGLETTNVAVVSPWFGAWVAGDDSTSFTFTVYLCNATANARLQDDDVWMELFYPSTDGSATHVLDAARMRSPGSTASQTGGNLSSDASTWTGITETAIKMSVSATPQYEGMAYARVYYARRGGSVIYVDPALYIT